VASLSTTLLTDHPDPNPRDPYSHGSLIVGNSFPWVTHRRSPKLAWGHSRSRGKADFTFNSESRHRAQWARSVLPIHFYSGPHVQPLPCTATDGRSSLRTRRRCFVIVPLPFVTVPCPFIIVPWRLNFFFCAVAFSAYPLTVLT
jgi:hypothetical protein